MILLLYVAAILGLCIFVNWWFVLALILPAFKLPMLFKRSRVLKVLASEYQYEFPATSPQAYTLNRMERDTRPLRPSDTELATLFMAVMVNSLTSKDDEVRAFAQRVRNNALRLLSHGAVSQETYARVQEVVQQKVSNAT